MNDEKLEIIDVNEKGTNTPNVVVNPTVEPVPIEKVEPVEIKGSDINYNDITIGNIVETVLNGEKVIGKVVNEYGPGKCALSIIYDNDKKHTAINRYSVTKVLGKVS